MNWILSTGLCQILDINSLVSLSTDINYIVQLIMDFASADYLRQRHLIRAVLVVY